MFVYARLNGSNSVPPSPPSVLDPTVLLNNFLTLIISSGKIYELAEVVRDLNKGDDLMVDQSYSERQLFEKAYERILSEFQIILNSSQEDTQKKLDKALKRNIDNQAKTPAQTQKATTSDLPVEETITENENLEE